MHEKCQIKRKLLAAKKIGHADSDRGMRFFVEQAGGRQINGRDIPKKGCMAYFDWNYAVSERDKRPALYIEKDESRLVAVLVLSECYTDG